MNLSCKVNLFLYIVGRTFTFEFACRLSCKTPLKNRPMQVVFTLEKG